MVEVLKNISLFIVLLLGIGTALYLIFTGWLKLLDLILRTIGIHNAFIHYLLWEFKKRKETKNND